MKPPKKRGVCCTHTPQEPQHSPERNSGKAIAQACKHRSTVTQRLPVGHRHFSKEICIVCGAFVRWLPKPANVERRTLTAFKLARLAMCEGLSKWERAFVHHISRRRQKQLLNVEQRMLELLIAKYLEGKT